MPLSTPFYQHAVTSKKEPQNPNAPLKIRNANEEAPLQSESPVQQSVEMTKDDVMAALQSGHARRMQRINGE